jgi:hypothetical protein
MKLVQSIYKKMRHEKLNFLNKVKTNQELETDKTILLANEYESIICSIFE